MLLVYLVIHFNIRNHEMRTATTDLLTALLQAATVVVLLMRPLRLRPGLVQQGEVSMISIYQGTKKH
jgi:hypothetical protein